MNIHDEIQFNITLERAEVAGCVISHYVNHPTVGMSIHIASSHVVAIRPCEAEVRYQDDLQLVVGAVLRSSISC